MKKTNRWLIPVHYNGNVLFCFFSCSLSIKQIRNLRSEYMALQNQIKRQVTFRAGIYLTQSLDLEL